MKKFLCLLLAAVMALSLVACGSQPAVDETKTNDKTDYVVDLSDITIGACVMSFEQEFMANLVVGYQEFMKQTGVNMLLTDGGNMEVEKPGATAWVSVPLSGPTTTSTARRSRF